MQNQCVPMLMKVLQYLTPPQSNTPKSVRTAEIMRSSMIFEEVENTSDQEDEEYQEISYEMLDDAYPTQSSIKPPLQTFTQHLQSKHSQKSQVSTAMHSRGPSKIQEIMTHLQAGVAGDFQSLVKDILTDSTSIRQSCQQLKVNLLDQMEQAINANIDNDQDDEVISSVHYLKSDMDESNIVYQFQQALDYRTQQQQQSYSSLGQQQQQQQSLSFKSLQDFCQPCEQTMESRRSRASKASGVSNNGQQMSNNGQQMSNNGQSLSNNGQSLSNNVLFGQPTTTTTTQIPPRKNKSRQRRKKSRVPKNVKYYLDIIEEQSNDQFTPDRSLADSLEEMDSVQSQPCFGQCSPFSGGYRSERRPDPNSSKRPPQSSGKKSRYSETDNEPTFRQISSGGKSIVCSSTSSFTAVQPRQMTLEDLDDILQGLNAFRTSRSNLEEEAILASWNKMCTEIIKKNLLPVSLNIERMQHQYEYNSTTSKRMIDRRKLSHNKKNRTIESEHSAIIDNSCVVMALDADTSMQAFRPKIDNHTDKSSSDILVDENITADLHLQFSPNFSDVCKRIQFTSGSFNNQEDMKGLKQRLSYPSNNNKENQYPSRSKLVSFWQYKQNNEY